MYGIGKNMTRKDAWEKVSGDAEYINDLVLAGMLQTELVTSKYAHAKIISIDVSAASSIEGVRAILTGSNLPLTGEEIFDRPILAFDKVRYFGEPIALVVADSRAIAQKAANKIIVHYSPLPIVNSSHEAFQKNSPLVHEHIESYKKISSVHPIPQTNVANWTKIRKGNQDAGFAESDIIVEETYSFPQSDHASMETRCSICEIKAGGEVHLYTCTQAPHFVRKVITDTFNLVEGKVSVHSPLVGGAYGGKSAVQLEYLAYLASKAAGGRPVKVLNKRETDLISSPVHIGLEAQVKLGCTKEGILKAAKITFLFDGGAYSDKGTNMSESAGIDCTGPYRIDHVWCDSYCLYTNHPYSTSFRGFSHSELTFPLERTMDMLAKKAGKDPLEFRLMNAIKPGDTTPTQALLNNSNIGNYSECLRKLRELIRRKQQIEEKTSGGKIRALGISGLWKTSNIPPDAGSGAVLTFNFDGSINLNCGVVEIGQGTRSTLAQIAAERLKINPDRIFVELFVDTRIAPDHWKTVASRGTFMAGRAVFAACEDAIAQIKNTASRVLMVLEEDLEIADEKVFVRANPLKSLKLSDVVFGYRPPGGNSIGRQVIGRGSYALRNIIPIDPETGKGKPGPEWTVGAEAVEVEFDPQTYNYEIKTVFAVLDCGRVINPDLARGQVTGAAHMGLSFASREEFQFTSQGIILNNQLRKYHLLRYGENPLYIVDFVETPFLDSPYGIRGIGEHGIIGIPAALGNSLSNAVGTELKTLPLTPEKIWKAKKEAGHDSI